MHGPGPNAKWLQYSTDYNIFFGGARDLFDVPYLFYTCCSYYDPNVPKLSQIVHSEGPFGLPSSYFQAPEETLRQQEQRGLL